MSSLDDITFLKKQLIGQVPCPLPGCGDPRPPIYCRRANGGGFYRCQGCLQDGQGDAKKRAEYRERLATLIARGNLARETADLPPIPLPPPDDETMLAAARAASVPAQMAVEVNVIAAGKVHTVLIFPVAFSLCLVIRPPFLDIHQPINSDSCRSVNGAVNSDQWRDIVRGDLLSLPHMGSTILHIYRVETSLNRHGGAEDNRHNRGLRRRLVMGRLTMILTATIAALTTIILSTPAMMTTTTKILTVGTKRTTTVVLTKVIPTMTMVMMTRMLTVAMTMVMTTRMMTVTKKRQMMTTMEEHRPFLMEAATRPQSSYPGSISSWSTRKEVQAGRKPQKCAESRWSNSAQCNLVENWNRSTVTLCTNYSVYLFTTQCVDLTYNIQCSVKATS